MSIAAPTRAKCSSCRLLRPISKAEPASALADPEPAEQESEVTVRPGDNLWSISKAALTEAWGRVPADTETSIYWSQVIAANRDRLIDGDNPSYIVPGQVFELPGRPSRPHAGQSGLRRTNRRAAQ